MRKILLCLGFAGFLVGCGQSYEEAIEVMCQAPMTCGAPCAEAAPDMRMSVLARHIEEQVRNGRARELFESFREMTNAERADALQREAEAAGLRSCRLADVFLGAESGDP